MPPIAPIVALAILSAQGGAAPSARTWAAGLASATPAERFATIDAIEALGLKALPPLREVAAKNPGEVRDRAEDLIREIGSRRLLRPTSVALELADRPASEAVETLKAATGFTIQIPPNAPAAKPVTLRTGPSAGFFETLDRLAAAAGLRHDPSPTFGPTPSPSIRLVPYEGAPAPTSYAGPYRVTLNRLERHREVAQVRPPAEPIVREQFAAMLDVVAEPGILIDRNGPARLIEAVDEEGNDLRGPSAADPSGSMGMRQWARDGLSTFPYRLPLRLPETRGSKIARLRGAIPITAVTRTDELFSAPLARIEGKTLSAGRVSVTITRAAVSGTNGTIDLIVRGESPPDPGVFARGPRQTTHATLHLAYNPDDHLRFEADDGTPFTTSSNPIAPPGPDGAMTYRVGYFPTRPGAVPARLRYFGVAGVATELPFDFRDLPIP